MKDEEIEALSPVGPFKGRDEWVAGYKAGLAKGREESAESFKNAETVMRNAATSLRMMADIIHK